MLRVIALAVVIVSLSGVSGTIRAVERVPFTAENLAKLPGLPSHLAHPKLGIALSGGGSKASSFGMGVLAGLNDAGVLKDVDVISSVSGGGYAAYFYFSRLLDAATARVGDTGPAAPADWFRHCLTNRAREYFATAEDRIAILSPSAGNSSQSVARDELMQPRYCPSSLVDVISDQDRKDRYRFQNHVGGFQDFLSPGFDYSRVGSREEGAGSAAAAVGLAGATIGSLPLHWAGNLIFDFGLRVAPIQHAYQEGLFRAYGYRPSRFNEASDIELGWEAMRSVNGRFLGGARGVDAARLEATRSAQARFGALEAIYRARALPEGFAKPPLWIVNVTASDRAGLDPRENDPLLHSFELTPFGYGSPCYGLHNAPPNAIGIPDAMAASAAFLDWQQRAKGGVLAPVGNALIDTFNFGMGIDYPNSTRSAAYRAAIRFVPFPFLRTALGLFPGCGGDGPAAFRFSDGGQSENTGLLALIRRRVATIVFADSSQDELGGMADICTVAAAGARGDPAMSRSDRLATDRVRFGWRIDVFGLPDLSELCDGSKPKKGYDVLDWRNPVLAGTIRIARIDPETDRLVEMPPLGTPCGTDEEDCLRLLLLKPGIDLRYFDVLRRAYWNNAEDATGSPSRCLRMREHISMPNEPRVKEREKLEGFVLGQAVTHCRSQLEKAVRRIPDAPVYPPSVIRFVLDNWVHISKDNRFADAKDRPGHEPAAGKRSPTEQFPQNSTFQLTLNSSPALYEAYRDLGRFAARIAAKHACADCRYPPVVQARACEIDGESLRCHSEPAR